jgi:hypothetical protein
MYPFDRKFKIPVEYEPEELELKQFLVKFESLRPIMPVNITLDR